MARQLRWDRANAEYADGASISNSHIIQSGAVNDGETVTVVHISWSAHHPAANAADGALMGVILGVIMGEAGWTAADVPDPWDHPEADWLYYEPGWFNPLLVGDTTGVVGELDVYPLDPGRQRTARSQRKSVADNTSVWFISANSSLAPVQSRHYLSLSYSIGILEVP